MNHAPAIVGGRPPNGPRPPPAEMPSGELTDAETGARRTLTLGVGGRAAPRSSSGATHSRAPRGTAWNSQSTRPRRPRTLTAAGLPPSTSRRAGLPRGAPALRADACAGRPCSLGPAPRAIRRAYPHRPRPSSRRMLCNQSTCGFSLRGCLTIPAMGGDKRAQATRASRGSSRRQDARHRRLRTRVLSWNRAACRRASSSGTGSSSVVCRRPWPSVLACR